MSHSESIRVHAADRKEAARLFPGATYQAIFAMLVAGYKKLTPDQKVATAESITGRARTHRTRKASAA